MHYKTLLNAFIVLNLLLTTQGAILAQGLSGEWEVELIAHERYGGGTKPVFELTESEGTISGEFKGAFGEGELEGTLNGNEIYLTYNISTADQPQVKVEYSGVVEGNTISGTYTLNGRLVGSFNGVRL